MQLKTNKENKAPIPMVVNPEFKDYGFMDSWIFEYLVPTSI